MTSFKLTAVVLAAGLSSRIGRQKALLPLGDLPAAQCIIRLLRQCGIDSIRFVTGHNREKLAPLLQAAGVETVENRHYLAGMFSSVKTGLTGLGSPCAGVLVLPVDIPLVRPRTLRELIRRFADAPDHIIYPTFQAKRGHPPLIPVSTVPDILEWQGGGGLKACLAENGALAIDVAVPDANILFDIDTPDEYEEALRRWEHMEVPSAVECNVILREFHPVSEEVFGHCRKVAQVAGAVASAFVRAGSGVDVGLVHAAAMLHDIAKGRPRHAEVGARWLAALGFDRTGDVIASHTDIAVRKDGRIGEAEILYLADKYVSGTREIPMENRFEAALARYGDRTDIREKIQKRKRAALWFDRCVETIVHRPVMEIILKAGITT